MNESLGYNYDIEFRFKIEREIIGAILSKADSENWQATRELLLNHQLKSNDFRDEEHKAIWTAIEHCLQKDNIPNLMMIVALRPNEYRTNNANQFEYKLTQCLSLSVGSMRSLFQLLMMLKQFVLMDFWNQTAHNLLYGNWNGRDVIITGGNVINSYDKLWRRLTESIIEREENDYAFELQQKVIRRSKGESVGVTTTIPSVDTFFQGGYYPGELVIIAARPGMGKTTYALITAWESYKRGNKIAFFSLEMPKNQLKSKLASLETGIDYHRIKRGELTSEELHEVLQVNKYIDQSGFIILDKVNYIEDISTQTKDLVKNHGIKQILVDYIQRTKVYSGLKIRESITEISRELKTIAKDNYISVVALSQLSRGVESRINKRPILSDLKESGSIEEDADVVAFLYRQAYYDEQQGMPVQHDDRFATEFIVQKGRDLGTTTIRLWLDPIKMKALDYRWDGNYET